MPGAVSNRVGVRLADRRIVGEYAVCGERFLAGAVGAADVLRLGSENDRLIVRVGDSKHGAALQYRLLVECPDRYAENVRLRRSAVDELVVLYRADGFVEFLRHLLVPPVCAL